MNNEDLAGRLVDREIYYCASHLISELTQKAEHFPEYQDDLYAITSWYETTKRIDGLQVRYIINLDERGEFYATMYQINDEGEDVAIFEVHSSQTYAPQDDLPWHYAGHLIDDGVDIRDCESVYDEIRGGYADHYLDANDDVEWIEEEDDDLTEAYEHWIISDWLADKLEAKGARVCKDLFGFTIWARTTTGQAIAMDSVIESIAVDLWG